MKISAQPQITLHHAQPTSEGLHTGSRLSRAVNAGHMLRLRRGVYVEVQDWLEAAPWERPFLTIAATAVADPDTVFCRTSALLLHGIPLLHPPQRVHIRTLRRSSVRVTAPTPLTGQRTPAQVVAARGLPPEWAGRLLSIPTQRHEPVIPSPHRREELREHARQTPEAASERLIPRVPLPPDALRICSGPSQGYQVEPLELATIDSVTRLPAADAVVVLDAVLARLMAARLDEDAARRRLLAWIEHIPSRRRRGLLEKRLAFADPRSESPGESYSRVRIHELGFIKPHVQTQLALDTGQARLDFDWPQVGVVGEFDGRRKYRGSPDLAGQEPAATVYAEKLREDAIRRTGRGVVRWGWRELQTPALLGTRLTTAGVPRRPASQIVSL